MPMTVNASPRVATPGTVIKLKGNTVADGKRFDVQITIAGPNNAAPASTKVQIDKAGAYSTTFTPAPTPGVYRVTAVAPDGQGRDTTSFQVGSTQQIGDAAITGFQRIVDDGTTTEARVSEAIKDLPESPAKQQLEEKVRALDDTLKSAPKHEDQFKQVLQKIAALQAKYPEAGPVFRDLYVHLGDEVFRTQSEADDRKLQILKELDASRAAGKLCDRIDAISEGFKAVSAIFNFAGSLLSITRGFLTDYAAGAAGPTLFPPALKSNQTFMFAFNEMGKFSIGMIGSPTAFVGVVVAFLADIGAYAADRYFDKYCERFGGPFTATMHGEVYRQGQPWWTFDMTLGGDLTLRYPKAEAGTAIHLTGEFEGTVAEYKEWDDALPVLFPKLMRGTATFKKVVKPAAIPWIGFEGRGAALLSPAAFSIPVEADLVGTHLTIHVKPARKEISDTYNTARAYVVVASPLALMPVVVSYNLPYKNAHFVVTYATEVEDTDSPITLDVTIGQNSMTAQRKWEHTKTGDGVKADYAASIKLCNPACE